MFWRGFNLLILVLVLSIIEEAITAVTRKLNTKVLTKSTPTAAVHHQPWASISPLLRNNFGEDGAGAGVDETCQCVMFYLCEENTVTNNTQCDDENMICCKTDTKVLIVEDQFGLVGSTKFSDSSSSATSETPHLIVEDQFGLVGSTKFSESSSSATSEWTPHVIVEDQFGLVGSTKFSDSSSSATSELVPSSETSLVASSTSSELSLDNPSTFSSTSTELYVDNPSSPVSTLISNDDFAECGIDRSTDPKTRITSDAVFKESPWMVAILQTSQDSTVGGTLICGGSLLSPHIVLTAAHCVHNLDVSTLKIRAGDLVLNGDSTEELLPHQDRTVKTITTHKNFSSKILHNDLALINVDEPFVYSSHVAPACSPVIDPLFAPADSYDSNDCAVTGWTRSTANILENKLRRVPAKVMNKSNCEESLRETRLGRAFKLHPSFLCAKEEQSVCKGNGGGPLVCVSRSNRRKYIQVGVVSWGVGCDSKLPGVYASLEANSEWITAEFDKLNALRGS